MTEYAPRTSQDYNALPYNQHLAMSHYSNGNGLSYIYGHGSIPYQTVNSQCSTYSPTYAANQGTSTTPLYIPSSGHQFPYSLASSRIPPTLPTQSRAYPMTSHYLSSTAHRSSAHQQRLTSPRDYSPMDDTECQDSPNQDTMLSEPVVPSLEGYPDVHEFDDLMKRYVQDLSPKKQDKALIHARRAANIKQVLIDKKTTSIESAQFRFWVKKMFTLEPANPKTPDHRKKICHEGKPVAVREKLFKILTKAHKQCQHGGRDKTSFQVRKVYSWVPKELISRFVKLCPTCQVRRGTSRNTPPESEVASPEAKTDVSPTRTYSAATSRKNSTVSGFTMTGASLPLLTAGFKSSSAFQQQNRWMTPLQPQTDGNHVSPTSLHNRSSRHDSYNTMPPMPLNCTNGNSSGLNFSSVNSYSNTNGSSTAYNSSSLAHSAHGHVPTGSAYDIKVETQYM
ncbi:hypothetical protein H2200_010697 [Cladophialophora chaetospira]|uniref:Integrase zinc-binding domain-containing protein n=1 Tax=Cladophialophora chaetospira TaxID=386627 RepID=A0AA38X0L3_9EURO|nr:hypothetical protein H2200_010697 [Cladophialophora chaetospira]